MTRNTAPGPALVVECVDAEAGEAGDLEREIRLQERFAVLALPVVHDAVHEAAHGPGVEDGSVEAAHVAVHADHRREPRREMDVGRPVLHSVCEQFGSLHFGSPQASL